MKHQTVETNRQHSVTAKIERAVVELAMSSDSELFARTNVDCFGFGFEFGTFSGPHLRRWKHDTTHIYGNSFQGYHAWKFVANEGRNLDKGSQIPANLIPAELAL